MIRPKADNVVLVLEPLHTVSQPMGNIHLVSDASKAKGKARASRWARVVASGPGYWLESKRRIGDRKFTVRTDVFVPNETRPGDRVLIAADSGQDYSLDLSIPRHNLGHDFEELCGEKGEFRVIRESEALLLEREVTAAE